MPAIVALKKNDVEHQRDGIPWNPAKEKTSNERRTPRSSTSESSSTQSITSTSLTSRTATRSSTAPGEVTVKEDFGTGIDYSSGSWTWEERGKELMDVFEETKTEVFQKSTGFEC